MDRVPQRRGHFRPAVVPPSTQDRVRRGGDRAAHLRTCSHVRCRILARRWCPEAEASASTRRRAALEPATRGRGRSVPGPLFPASALALLPPLVLSEVAKGVPSRRRSLAVQAERCMRVSGRSGAAIRHSSARLGHVFAVARTGSRACARSCHRARRSSARSVAGRSPDRSARGCEALFVVRTGACVRSPRESSPRYPCSFPKPRLPGFMHQGVAGNPDQAPSFTYS
jgi:hypothetical protein